MTTQQQAFVHANRTSRWNIGRPKNHRICFFMPAWMRDGYESEAHHYHDRASAKEKFDAINDPQHPNHDLAKRAAELKL